VRLERLVAFKKLNDLIGNQTSDPPARSKMPQPIFQGRKRKKRDREGMK
jgi:hypothetical protein